MNLQMLKKAMLAYVSAVKFVWSEIAYPLSIIGKKLMNLRGYRVYGNSVQDGTPTPETPIEIQSVGDLSTKNLFDKDKEKYNVFMNSNTVVSKTNYYTIFVNVENISNFTISTKSEKYAYYGLCDSIEIGSEIYEHNYFEAKISRKVINNTHKYVGISIYYTNISDFDSIQIEEGTTATEYEPYHKYKIPVVARGKNMATAQQVYSTASNYYECIEDGRNCTRCLSDGKSYTGINFKENTQYTVRFEAKTVIRSGYEEDTSGEALFAFTHTDGTRKLIVVYGSKDWKYYEATSYANKTIKSVGMYAYNYKHWIYINVDTFQIEEGTSTTEYEPYIPPVTTNIFLDEPLRKVGNYADYVDFEKQKVVRPVEVLDDTGTKTIDESLGVINPPTEETVKLPALPQFKGTTIYEVGTNIKPSGMEAKHC